MSNKTKRYTIVMVISVIFNMGFYFIAHFEHLPVWMDLQGTALAALVLEPAAGLIVGLINNFIEAIFFYDASSLIFYGTSAIVALIVGLYLKKDGKVIGKRIIPTMFYVLLATSLLTTLLTVWRSGGVSDSGWERHFYDVATSFGAPKILADFFGIFVLKLFDVIAGTLLIAMVYGILPKKLKSDEWDKETID